eukprot:TRINITY_DN84793_c0_g1_i1.p1 TRINITY_DN84793_c0_g1~~TRINITY_DN84793_c0_g1_i1.p1  ORF type:complete len:486 (-),score=72.94 TRINITY_DN84793_c0_g1_i1:132-1589(-)
MRAAAQAIPAVNLPPHGHSQHRLNTPKDAAHHMPDGAGVSMHGTPLRTYISGGHSHGLAGSAAAPPLSSRDRPLHAVAAPSPDEAEIGGSMHAPSGGLQTSPGSARQLRSPGSGPLLTAGGGYAPNPNWRSQERLPSPSGAAASGERMPSSRERGVVAGALSPDASSASLRRGAPSTHSAAALLAPAAMAIAASTPVLRGRGSGGLLPNGGENKPVPPSSAANVSKSSLLAGSSLGHLISKVSTSIAEREQEIRKQLADQREIEDLLSRSKEELQQLVSVVSQLHELQQSATEVLPDVLHMGPERPRCKPKPPFHWQPSQEYSEEFEVTGENGEVVTKTKDFEDQGWVIPVGGSWRLLRGGLYRWTIKVERKCPSRPQLQLGIHGLNHSQPWRLVTTSRCSWSRDDEPWQDRPGGDRLIDEGDFVHIEVDLRANTPGAKAGTFALAVNDEPYEQFFDDIPLGTSPLIPVVSMGGGESRVRLCPNY